MGLSVRSIDECGGLGRCEDVFIDVNCVALGFYWLDEWSIFIGGLNGGAGMATEFVVYL